jgi:hypothetical protein
MKIYFHFDRAPRRKKILLEFSTHGSEEKDGKILFSIFSERTMRIFLLEKFNVSFGRVA